MRIIRGLLIILCGLLIASCSPRVDDQGYVLIDTEDNPNVLPYRFVEFDFGSRQLYPLVLNREGLTGLYGILYKKQLGDSITSILFRAYPPSSRDVMCLSHISTAKLDAHTPFDYNGDGTEELAITYFRHDTLWLQLLNHDCQIIFTKKITVVHDQTGDGIWDGSAHVTAIQDLNGDGNAEILITCNARLDRYPRRLICVDWLRDSILWEFDCAAHMDVQTARVIHPPFCRGPLILLGDYAPKNGAKTEIMDDAHSHLVCLNGDGSLRWTRVTGGKFTSTRPYIIDYDNDGIPEVCARFSHRTEDDRLAGGLLVLDPNGQLIDSVAFAHQIHSILPHDYDSDGREDIIISFDDGTLIVTRQNLDPIAKLRYVKPLRLLRVGDFCGNGGTQILARGPFRELWLFDSEFRPLACLPDGGEPEILSAEKEGFVILVHRDIERIRTYFNVLKRNPWYRGFFLKYKIHITGLVGALAATLVVVVFYQRRTKRNLAIIERQKEQLEDIHKQLKKAQRQIISQEKYKQAKDIAGGVAHEIHNALCPAINSLEILNNRLELGGEADLKRNHDLLKLTKAAIARGLQMTELVSAYSRLESEKRPQPVNLKRLLGEVMEANRLRRDELDVKVSLDISEGQTIKCDRTHAFSLFNNLMLNALDALAGLPERAIDISAQHHHGQIIIHFADTGQGIPPESLTRIFDVFYSTKPSTGTGLGLSMVKKIVELYGGTIEVESVLDKGTEFIIILDRV